MPTTKAPSYDTVYVSTSIPKRMHLCGKLCRVLGYGATRHSVLLEFENGERVIASARAIRKKK